ncbi:acyloxyacyl hydrolase [Nitratifractor sp.]
MDCLRRSRRWMAVGLALYLPYFTYAGGTIPRENPQTNRAIIDSLTLSIGQSKDNIDIYRIGLRRDFERKWWVSGWGYLSGYWEASLNYWSGYGEHNFGVALSPVFAYYFNPDGDVHPYLEGGIGASLWTRTRMGPRKLSSAYLFEDRLGAGIRTGRWDLSFRYMHYSNAGLVKPNDGIDIFVGSVSYRF